MEPVLSRRMRWFQHKRLHTHLVSSEIAVFPFLRLKEVSTRGVDPRACRGASAQGPRCF